MAGTLIIYATTDGQTRRICERLKAKAEAAGAHVALAPIDEVGAGDLEAFDRIVIGASVRNGRHHRRVHAFVDAHARALDAKPNAFFSVNLVARKPDKNQPGTNPYLQKFLKEVRWRPKATDVFAVKLDYPSYRFADRLMIRLIMLVTGGPTDPRAVVEFTDWQRVDAFAQRVFGI